MIPKEMTSYRFNTTVSATGLIPIPFAHNLFNKQVEVIVSPCRKRRTTKERLSEFFKLSGVADASTEISWGKPAGQEIW
jgi:hypothetical protein